MKKGTINQEVLRYELVKVLDAGLKASAIAKYIDIDHTMLCKFRKGYIELSEVACLKLQNFLRKVRIPR